MSRIQQYQASFTIGELDPLLQGRIDLQQYYISEKTVKPIGHKHPFIVMGSVGTLKELRREGFKTFHLQNK